MIRKARPEDFEQVFNLLKELWPDRVLSKEKSKDVYEQTLPRSLIADDGEIIGYSSFQMILEAQIHAKIAILTALIVREDKRGKGVGTKLLEETMKEAKEKECVEFQFASTFGRKRAHEFYEKFGFKKTAYYFWKEL